MIVTKQRMVIQLRTGAYSLDVLHHYWCLIMSVESQKHQLVFVLNTHLHFVSLRHCSSPC